MDVNNCRCQSGDSYEVWTEASSGDPVSLGFSDLGCEAQPLDSNQEVGPCGPGDRGREIRLGFDTRPGEAGVESVTLTVCYDRETSVNIWSRHNLWDEIEARSDKNPIIQVLLSSSKVLNVTIFLFYFHVNVTKVNVNHSSTNIDLKNLF